MKISGSPTVFSDEAINNAKSLKVLEISLEELYEEAKPLGLKVSLAKTKVQVFRSLINETVQYVHACDKDFEIMGNSTFLDSFVHNKNWPRHHVFR